jgi:hypothetical protein
VGHLGCFCSLAIMNSAVINMGVRCFCHKLTHNPLSISIGVLVDYIASLFLASQEPPYCFP